MPTIDPEARRAYDRTYAHAHLEQRRVSNRASYARHRAQRLLDMAKWQKENPEKFQASYKKSYKKHQEKRIASSRAFRLAHPEYVSQYSRAYYAEHPEQRRAASRAWKKANPDKRRDQAERRRTRLANAPICDLTQAQWQRIKEHYKHRCYYCGAKPKRLEKDHIIALAKGGSHTASNIVPACRSCNSSKNTGPPPMPVQPLLLVPPDDSSCSSRSSRPRRLRVGA